MSSSLKSGCLLKIFMLSSNTIYNLIFDRSEKKLTVIFGSYEPSSSTCGVYYVLLAEYTPQNVV